MGHGRITVDRTATSGNHMPLKLQRLQHLPFDATQGFVSLIIDNRLQGAAGLLLDNQVRIGEAKAQALGQQNTHRAFAAAGHANQHHVVRIHLHTPAPPIPATGNTFRQ
jgi:hypothetical protein